MVGGIIKVKSEVNVGSCFTLKLKGKTVDDRVMISESNTPLFSVRQREPNSKKKEATESQTSMNSGRQLNIEPADPPQFEDVSEEEFTDVQLLHAQVCRICDRLYQATP